MAQKFGGKYSPQAQQSPSAPAAPDHRVKDAAGARANVLFVPAALLGFLSIREGATLMIVGLTASALMLLSAWLTREGLRAEANYNARAIARRPALPRKIFGSVLIGFAVALASIRSGSPVLAAPAFGIVATALYLVAFGLDPLKNKRMEGIDDFQQDRVARVVDEAEDYLAAMADHISTLKDRALDGRIATFQSIARRMIRTVEEDPRDLTGARKYLGVYLMGARDASAKFADLYKRTGDQSARADYEQLLIDLEQNFAARTDKMLTDDRSDMDIEIKVLRDRLQREGVKPL